MRRRGRPREEKWDNKDDRQPVMARLAAWRMHSNLVILATLEKENHPGEA